MKTPCELSIVVPVYNEAGNIQPLHDELKRALAPLGKTYEIIYINDGSQDTSLEELTALKEAIIIDLNKNYGQATALDAGFKAAQGDIIVSLDGDGQNDPADIPLLLSVMNEKKLDVVAGWRKDRKDAANIKTLTLLGRRLRKILISDPIHDSGCTLRAYRNRAAKSLDIGGEMHRYILTLLRWKGFTLGEVPVNHRPRKNGVSKYGVSKAIRGFIDLIYVWFIYKYSQRPLHLFGYMSVVSLFLGIGSGAITIYEKIFNGLSINRNGWFFISFFFLLAGILFFSFGMIIDLLLRIHLNNSPFEKRYSIRKTTINE
jgi:glycosyltransferase involved in cell wall biosynthesis